MPNDAEQLSAWRIVAAFIIAPLVPAALVSTHTLFDGVDNASYLKNVAIFGLLGAFPAAILFGVPALLLLRRRAQPTLLNIALVGGLVATLPFALLIMLLPNPTSASIDLHATVIDGHRTFWGWYRQARFLAYVFLLGLLGGAAFWLIAIFGRGATPAREGRT